MDLEDKEDQPKEEFKQNDDNLEESLKTDDQAAPPFYDMEQAKKLKEQANEEFKFERFDQALKLYEQAINLCPPTEINDLAIFHNNRGLCFQRMNQNDKAKKEFSKAIELKPDYVKPRTFRMKICRDEEEYDLALEDAKKIEEVDPMYPGIHKIVKDLDKLQKEKFEKMKTEVLGNLKNLGNSLLGKFGISLDNFKLNQNQDGTYNINYQNQNQ